MLLINQKRSWSKRMITKSSVFIENLELETYIGLHEWEKDKRQVVHTELNLQIDISKAADSDDVSASVDYEKLALHLRSWAYDHRVELLEKFAFNLVNEIKSNFSNIDHIELKLTKKGVVAHTDGCGIKLAISV